VGGGGGVVCEASSTLTEACVAISSQFVSVDVHVHIERVELYLKHFKSWRAHPNETVVKAVTCLLMQSARDTSHRTCACVCVCEGLCLCAWAWVWVWVWVCVCVCEGLCVCVCVCVCGCGCGCGYGWRGCV